MILCLSLSIIGCEGNNELEVGQKTTMTIDKIYDAGTRVKGEVIEAVFNIENTGDYPLVFGEIKGSCSCTVADKPEAPILPGGKGCYYCKSRYRKIQE